MGPGLRACVVVAGALLLGGPGAAAAEEGAKVREFKGKRVPLERSVPGQATGRSHLHPLGDEIRAGGRSFAVVRDASGKAQVAVKAGAPPSAAVRDDRPVTLAWSDEQGAGRIVVRFQPVPGGGWAWYTAEAVAVDIEGQGVRFYDLDGDGRIEPSADGWSLAEAGLFLPLDGPVVAGPHVVALEGIDAEVPKVRASIARMEGNDLQVLGTIRLNRIRAHIGLVPVVHDREQAGPATSHARYLEANHWKDDFDPFGQRAGNPGASDAYDSLHGKCLIQRTPHDLVFDAWFTSWGNRGPLVHPLLRRIGLSEGPPEMTVFSYAALFDAPMPKEVPWAYPLLVPAEGTLEFPTGFSPKGEMMPPVPAPESRGPPLWAYFWRTSRLPAKFESRLFEQRVNKRKGLEEVPVPAMASEKVTGPGVARGCVPEAPLKPATWYRVAFTFELDGKPEERSARFRTK